ncbi:AaceriAFR563Cp [[Ashbya] aceris (nom. inval.)]|nr:AaceriAFR563Cp [[Ashbya] aceris (nom. inval.)]
MGPIIKIKKPKPSPEEPGDGNKVKRIKLKGNGADELKDRQLSPTQTANNGPKIKLTIKKKDLEPSSAEPKAPVKLKLNLKKDTPPTPVPASALTKAPRIRVKPPRIPGEGYDSEASDIEDDPLMEEGIVLRVLPDLQAEFVKNSIESGDYSNISIKWKAERHAVVNINGHQYGAVLVNLPTVIEVNKSVDRKNMLKAFDVSQMLLCVALINREEDVFDLEPPDTEDLVKKHFESYEKEISDARKIMIQGFQGGSLTDAESKHMDAILEKGYDYKHGITAPLYNVRNRRFRRRMTGSEIDYVDRTVEFLLKQDGEAEEFTYELVDEDAVLQKSASTIDLAHFAQKAAAPGMAQPAPSADSVLFGVEDDDHDDLELELEQALQVPSEADPAAAPLDEAGDEVEQDNGDDEDDDDDEEDDDDDDEDDAAPKPPKPEPNENLQHNELLRDELGELESILQQNRDKLAKATNPLLKSRFVDSIAKLEKEVDIKRKQLLANEEILDTSPATSSHQTPRPEDDEELDDDDDDDELDEEDLDDQDDDEEIATPAQATTHTSALDDELDQEDMDMMMLFGAEGDD